MTPAVIAGAIKATGAALDGGLYLVQMKQPLEEKEGGRGTAHPPADHLADATHLPSPKKSDTPPGSSNSATAPRDRSVATGRRRTDFEVPSWDWSKPGLAQLHLDESLPRSP